MSCQPSFNGNTYIQPLLGTRPWFLRDFSLYDQVTYSVAPCWFHPRAHVPVPVAVDASYPYPYLVVPSSTPVTFKYGQLENSYYRYATAEMNAWGIHVLEKRNTIHSFSGEKAVKSYQPSGGSEKSRFSEAMLNLVASGDHSDVETMEQREREAGNHGHKSAVLSAPHESEHSEEIKMDDISDFCSKLANCSTSSQSCYVSAPELNLSKGNVPSFSSLPDEELESSHKEGGEMPITLHDVSETDINLDNDGDFSYFSSNQNDGYKCSGLDDDSTLEYHSAEEQDYVGHRSGRQYIDHRSEAFQDKELSNEDQLAGVQHPMNKQKNESSTSGCSVGCDCDKYSEIPEFPQALQDSKCETQGKGLNFDDQPEDCSVNAKVNNPKLFSMSNSRIDKNVKTDSFSGRALKSGNTQVLPQERKCSLHAHTSSGDTEISDSSGCDVLVNSNKANCTYKSYCHCGRCEENFPNLELNSITYMNNLACKNQSTINQAVDASSDFRACFTTSRATNVKAAVVSRGQNTVITMMNKERPKPWLMDSHRSVACNTDWSCLSNNMEMSSAQAAMDMLENTMTSDKAKHGPKSKMEDLLDWKNSTSRDLHEIPNRVMQLSQEITSRLPNCCKEILQRAIKAEMQLLKIRYQMYQQHCWQTSSNSMDQKESVNGSALGTGKSVSQGSLPQNMEASSLPLVICQKKDGENSDPDLSLFNENSEEKKYELVKDSSSDTKEISEGWFDATENLTETDSSLQLTDQLKPVGTSEIQTIKDTKNELKNIYRVHVADLGPLVSEIDLWLHFQKYNVSEISICEYSANYRYAFLSFKAACDAKLAVKEMNAREIKGQAVKVQLVKTAKENGHPDYQSYVKPEYENQEARCSCEKNVENRNNCNAMFKAPASAAATCKMSAISSKGPDISQSPLGSSLPLASVPGPLSDSPKVPLSASAPYKAPKPDLKSSKPLSENTHLEIDQEDITEGLLPLGSVQFTPNPSTTFIPPNALNLRSFRRVVKKLEDLHPDLPRDNILDALVEIKENKGLLSGLPLSSIVQMTSSLLKKRFGCKSEEKQINLRSKQ